YYRIGDTHLPVNFERPRLDNQRIRMRGWALFIINNYRLYAISQQLCGHHQARRTGAYDQDLSMCFGDYHWILLMIDQKNCWALMQLRYFFLPFGDGFCLNKLGVSRQVAGYTKTGSRAPGF